MYWNPFINLTYCFPLILPLSAYSICRELVPSLV